MNSSSMKKLSIVAIATLAIAGAAQAAVVYAPVAVTGFNQDFVVGIGETYATGVSASLDNGAPAGGGNTFFELGANTAFPAQGLPTGTFTSAAGADHSFGMPASYAGSNNGLLINQTSPSGTLGLGTPAAYSDLSFLVTCASNWTTNKLDYTIHYADATTATGTFSVSDWGDGGSSAAYNALARSNGTTWNGDPARDAAGNPIQGNSSWFLYQVDVNGLSTGSNITSIDLSRNTGTGNMAVFAVSGVSAVPEPATVALLGLGSLSLLMRRKRA